MGIYDFQQRIRNYPKNVDKATSSYRLTVPSGYNTGGLTLASDEFLSLAVWLSWGWRVYPKLIHMSNWQAGMFTLLPHPSLYDRRLVSPRASGPKEQWIKREHTVPLMKGFVSFCLCYSTSEKTVYERKDLVWPREFRGSILGSFELTAVGLH